MSTWEILDEAGAVIATVEAADLVGAWLAADETLPADAGAVTFRQA